MIRGFSKKWLQRKKKRIGTEDKQHEDTFVASNQSQTLEEKFDSEIGKMAAFFAHEIRNPLTSIIGFTQFIEKEANAKSETSIANYSSIIRDEANRIEYLIQELLTLSKYNLNHDNLTIIDVKHSLEKIVTIYSLQFENKNIVFSKSITNDLYITGNASRFERLLINLIKNAGEAIGENGTIDIKVTKEKKRIVISIIDSGPGITPEQLEYIFSPFYTTKEDGTGLGLPICKTIVEALQGELEFDNYPNKGVQVKIIIPESKHTSFEA